MCWSPNARTESKASGIITAAHKREHRFTVHGLESPTASGFSARRLVSPIFPRPPSFFPPRLPRLPSLCRSSFHVSSFCSSQSYQAFLSRLGSRPPSLRLYLARGARSSAAAPVAFICLAAPSRLLHLACYTSPLIRISACPSP